MSFYPTFYDVHYPAYANTQLMLIKSMQAETREFALFCSHVLEQLDPFYRAEQGYPNALIQCVPINQWQQEAVANSVDRLQQSAIRINLKLGRVLTYKRLPANFNGEVIRNVKLHCFPGCMPVTHKPMPVSLLVRKIKLARNHAWNHFDFFRGKRL